VAAFSALLFDFDGLLCDTERAAYRSWVWLYHRFGLTFPEEVWAAMAGRPDGELLARADLVGRLGYGPDERIWLDRRRLKWRLADTEPARPGVPELLRHAGDRGLALAVVSNSPAGWLRFHLRRLGVAGWFATVVCGADAVRHKPAPDLYRVALRRLARTPAQAVAFEDTARGVAAARAAGLRCVGVPNATGAPADLAAADLVLDSLQGLDLPTLEGRLNGWTTPALVSAPGPVRIH
jgi:HAD superfamily hydrolase (TIGR01509 family)